MRIRNNRVWVRLSDDELAKFKSKVKRTGLSREAYLRLLINGKVPKEKPDDRFYVVMRQLIGLCNNAHQLTKKANALGFVDAPMLRDEAKKWTAFRLELKQKYLTPEDGGDALSP